MYQVYCLKNSDNEVVYVGYTKRKLHDRWRRHKDDFPDRINLDIELIKITDDKEEAKRLEVKYIQEFNTLHPNGLNKALGHVNNYGSMLVESGKATRFGTRKKYPGEEAKRKRNAKKALHKICKAIRCKETGQVWRSGRACAKDLGVSPGMITMVIRGKRLHVKGLTLELVPK